MMGLRSRSQLISLLLASLAVMKSFGSNSPQPFVLADMAFCLPKQQILEYQSAVYFALNHHSLKFLLQKYFAVSRVECDLEQCQPSLSDQGLLSLLLIIAFADSCWPTLLPIVSSINVSYSKHSCQATSHRLFLWFNMDLVVLHRHLASYLALIPLKFQQHR